MSTTTQRSDVVQYVAEVRAELDDLDAETLGELVDGLDADLSDAAAESAQPLAVLMGPAARYAAELRAAAGLPPRPTGPPPAPGQPAEPQRRTLADALDLLHSQTWWPGLRDFALTVRPVWWVLRAFIAVELLRHVFVSAIGIQALLPLLALAIWVSVELGRGRWGRRRGLAVLVLVGNAVAVLTLLLTWPMGMLGGSQGDSGYVEAGPTGLSRDGQPVRNVFPYDAQGRLLSGVQLFDQDGQPLEVDESARYEPIPDRDGLGPDRQPVPALDTANRPVWNVFPLSEAPVDYADRSGGAPVGGAAPAVPWAMSVPPVQAATPTSTASSTTSAAPTPSPTPKASASR